MGVEVLRKNGMMAHLLDALESGKDIGHYGRLVFAMVARHFLGEDELLSYLQKNPDAEPLLRLYQQAPSQEWIETQKENVNRLIQPASEDQLASRARVSPW